VIVLDASALVDTLVSVDRGPRVAPHLEAADLVCAPDVLRVETTSALWRMVRSGALTDEQAATALAQAGQLDVRIVSHAGLVERAWRLRTHVQITDAFYLACAQELGATLLTTDAHLARGHHQVPITLVT
jgi:predicted nucleic acid-binding protein